jgi:hypothetical protein
VGRNQTINRTTNKENKVLQNSLESRYTIIF